MRTKLDQELREKEKIRLAKEEADANKRKAKEAKEAEQTKRAANRPLQINFRAADSKRDVTLPRQLCGNPTCGKGWEAGKWLYACPCCKKAYHETHTEYTLFRESNGKEFWSCTPCTEQRERTGSLAQLIGSDLENHRAPDHQEAADDRPANNTHPADREILRDLCKTSEARTKMPDNEAQLHINFVPSTPSAGGDSVNRPRNIIGTCSSEVENSVQKELNFSSGNSTTERVKAPTVTMKEYLVWEAIPKDWKAPMKNGIPQDHPTCGWGKPAYQNWRRKNINLRDTHVAGSAARGPLFRAISTEIKTLIGTHLLLHPEKVSHLWNKWDERLTESQNVAAWCDADPTFSWVYCLDDPTLLQLLDPIFGIERAGTFLTRRFAPDLPRTNPQGEINYHSLEFAQ